MKNFHSANIFFSSVAFIHCFRRNVAIFLCSHVTLLLSVFAPRRSEKEGKSRFTEKCNEKKKKPTLRWNLSSGTMNRLQTKWTYTLLVCALLFGYISLRVAFEFDTSQWKPWRWFALEKEFSISIFLLVFSLLLVLLLLSKLFRLLRATHYISNWILSSQRRLQFYSIHFILVYHFNMFNVGWASIFLNFPTSTLPVEFNSLAISFSFFNFNFQANYKLVYHSVPCVYISITHGSKSITNGCIHCTIQPYDSHTRAFPIFNSFPFS